MSHLCTIKTELRDIKAIEEACLALGWTLKQGGRVRFYYGESQEEADHTIEFNGTETASRTLESGKYNLGLVKTESGYEVRCDNAMAGDRVLDINKQDDVTLGVLGKLKQHYAVALLQRQVSRKRQHMKQEIQTDGSIRVTIETR